MDCKCCICMNNKPFEMPKEIIEATAKGELVLFCGAGISTEGKTVLPYSFYSSIKEELGLDDYSGSFSNLMQEYCNQPNGRKKLLQGIRKRFQYIHSFPELERNATEFHRELAPIYQIKTIVTTNWDTYFEQYCGATPITIPEDFAFFDDKSRNVLKIHGSIDNLNSVVATTEDYEKCYKQLQNGIIGASLKSILGTKTVVFVGFSFGDEDFAQIINYLRDEMGELFPHIYLVTLDDKLKERLDYKNCTDIITSGSYFLHVLKNTLTDKGLICNVTVSPLLEGALEAVEEIHERIAEIDLKLFPLALYTLAYQDGIIHAWERFNQNNCTGEYHCPGKTDEIARRYEKHADLYRKHGSYWHMAYCEGYAKGLLMIGVCDANPDEIVSVPLFYIPSSKKKLISIDVFFEELDRLSKTTGKYVSYAKKFVGDDIEEGITLHHPPYLI